MAYEDFTTYTEVDEGNDIVIDGTNKVLWTGLKTRQETGYLYKDKGVDYFSGDFTHKFVIRFTAPGSANSAVFCAHWMLANIIGDRVDIINASGDALMFRLNSDNENLRIEIMENGAGTVDGWLAPGPISATPYYIEIVRDDDGGANNTGRLTAYIRTGSHSGVLRDTLVVDSAVGEQNDFRYVYGVATTDNSHVNPGTYEAYTKELDIGETPAGWTGIINGISSANIAKINGISLANIAKVNGVASS